MKFRNNSGYFVALLSIILFTISITGIVQAGIVDEEVVDVLYLFDEGEGDVAKDSSPNGRDGTIMGAQYAEGVFGTALMYDGVDDNLLISGYMGVGGKDPRTTVFWFKASSTRDHSWVKWGPNTGGAKYYIRGHVSGQQCFLRIEVNGGQNYGQADVCDGEWHHCAVVFPDGADSVQDTDLYVDGVLQENTGGDREMNTGVNVEVNAGARLTGHTFMHGLLDELAIFSAALDAEQINDIMDTGLYGTVNVDPQGKLATSWGRIKRY